MDIPAAREMIRVSEDPDVWMQSLQGMFGMLNESQR